MAKSFAEKFYHSKVWKECRKSYINSMNQSVRGMCERCIQNGKYVLGKILHHKIVLNEINILDHNVSLNHKNLELLCQDCHNKEHMMNERRIEFDKNGNIIKVNPPYFKG